METPHLKTVHSPPRRLLPISFLTSTAQPAKGMSVSHTPLSPPSHSLSYFPNGGWKGGIHTPYKAEVTPVEM